MFIVHGHLLYLGHGGAALGLLLAAHLLGHGVALLLRHSLQQSIFIASVLGIYVEKAPTILINHS